MRTPSTTKAIATPSTSTHGQNFDSAGTTAATIDSTTATASFQNMSAPPPGRTVLRDFQRVAVGGQHVHRCTRLQRLPSLDARVPARAAVAHPREARRRVDPAFEARRHAGVDVRHLRTLVAGAV